MKELRNHYIGCKISKEEKEVLELLKKTMGHKSFTDFLLTAVYEYAKTHTNIDLKTLSDNRRTRWER